MADSEELRAGRQAAVECVQALREFQVASTLKNQESQSDYRPHLRRLFMAVRDGFGPISRCWHGTFEVFSPPDSPGSGKSTPVAPILAWQSAVTVFWQVVCYTPYVWSAIVSWDNWDDGFDPTVDDGPSLRKWDAFVWYHIRDRFASLDEKVWGQLIERLNKTSVEESSTIVGQPGFPVSPPRFPERVRSLPSEKYELEKLLRDLEGLIAEFEDALQHDEQIDRVTAMVASDPSLLPDATRYVGSIQKVPVPNVNMLVRLLEFRFVEYASCVKQLVASNSENERIVAAMAKSREQSEQQLLLQGLVARQRDGRTAFDGLLVFLHRLRNEVVIKMEESSVASSGKPTPAGQPAAVNETEAKPGEDRTLTSADDSGCNAKEGLAAKVERLKSEGARPVWIEAYVSYYLALASGELRLKHTQKEAYKLIRDEEMYQELGSRSEEKRFGLRFGEIPKIKNWIDYNRKARHKLGELKNSSRAGRESRVGASDVEVDSTGPEQGKKLNAAKLRDIRHQKQVDNLRELLANACVAKDEAAERIWDEIVQSLERTGVTEPHVQQMCKDRNVKLLGEFINSKFPPTA